MEDKRPLDRSEFTDKEIATAAVTVLESILKHFEYGVQPHHGQTSQVFSDAATIVALVTGRQYKGVPLDPKLEFRDAAKALDDVSDKIDCIDEAKLIQDIVERMTPKLTVEFSSIADGLPDNDNPIVQADWGLQWAQDLETNIQDRRRDMQHEFPIRNADDEQSVWNHRQLGL